MKRFTCVAPLIFYCVCSVAQQPPVTKDANAVAIIQQSLAAMGGGQTFVDVQATGTTTLYGDSGSVSYPITLQATGKANVRSSLTKPSGVYVYVTDGQATCADAALATATADSQIDLFARRIDFVPALTILADYARPDIQVQYVRADTLGGSTVDVVALSFIPPGLTPSPQAYTATQRSFFIDRATGFVLKIQFITVADALTLTGLNTEVVFSNYQTFSGFAVPMDQATYINGNLGIDLALTSVAFNTGLDSSLFAMTCEGN
jgi:hypothetical protein